MPSGGNGSEEFEFSLDSVGRIDQSAHVRMESVERNDFGPGATPALPNVGYFRPHGLASNAASAAAPLAASMAR